MKNTNTTTPSSNTKELQNKPKFTNLIINGETWQYYFVDQYYDFRIYITSPSRTEHCFVRNFYRKAWANKIRKPFVRSEVVKRYIEIFIKSSNQ